MFEAAMFTDILTAVSVITWDVDPIAFKAGPLTFRYYGVLFATGLMIGYGILRWQYDQAGEDPDEAVTITYALIAAVIIGSRLGHVFFYEPERYLANPADIIKFWEGGLASHGAAIGLAVTVLIYIRLKKMPFLVLADRVALTIPLVTTCVRLGNFFNSEIVGRTTDVPWAVIFVRYDMAPRHPSQLYEASVGIILFIFMYFINKRYAEDEDRERPLGLMLAIFLIGYFGMRFGVEFFKEYQTLEGGLTMGQWLSLPGVLAGSALLWAALKGPLQGKTASEALAERRKEDDDDDDDNEGAGASPSGRSLARSKKKSRKRN
jgi:phosphatidylglycerol---prolipoprotein diacylglyceryl transferase